MIKFGTSGFREVIAEGFTKSNIQKIAQALAKIIKKEKSNKPVAIGYDKRFFADRAAVWFTEVLNGNNIKVKLYNKSVPSPTVMYTVMTQNLDYGVIMTASHNPHIYNGLKIVLKGGCDCNNEVADKIVKLANSKIKIKTMSYEVAQKENLVEGLDNVKDYIKFINNFVSKNIKTNKLKVLFNTMHGACSDYAETLAKQFKLAKYEVVNGNEDPYFERKLPAPEDSNLEEFKKQVVKGKFNIGVAVDGDGDRLGVVDEKGTFHDNNVLMGIVYYYLIKHRGLKGDVVKNNSTSILLDKLAEKFGYKCHEVPVGFKYISAKMSETDALLGGESSGGLTMRNYIPSKDSFFSISLILDAMVNINKPLSSIVELVKKEAGYISTYTGKSLPVANKKKIRKALFSGITPNFSYKATINQLKDGAKYVFEDGSWVVIRFSGTENLVRYCLEFPTEIECERNIKAIDNFIDKYGN